MVHGSILLLRRGALLSAHRPDRAAETDIHLAFHSVRGRISSCAFPDALGQQQPGVTVAVKSIGRFEGVLDAVRIGGCRRSVLGRKAQRPQQRQSSMYTHIAITPGNIRRACLVSGYYFKV